MVDNVKIGNLYAVHHGDYAGQMFALINFNEKLSVDKLCNSKL